MNVVAIPEAQTHPAPSEWSQRDWEQHLRLLKDFLEQRAASGLSPVRFDGAAEDSSSLGNIGIIANDDHLALATADLIKLRGGTPANFMGTPDCGNNKQMAAALKIILSNRNVRAILINIFGNEMTRCDHVAEAIVAACQEIQFRCHLVVRLEGVEAERGWEILAASDGAIVVATDMNDAAQKVITIIEGNSEDDHLREIAVQ